MLSPEQLVCWELPVTSDPMFADVRQLYESTQAPEERIPWEWLERSVARRATWRPGKWCPHLLVAAIRDIDEPGPICGFAYGGHFPHYGGYVCYLGVEPAVRQRGVGSRLFEQFFRVLAVDAGAEGLSLPFVIWESHRPKNDALQADWELWGARLRLFDRIGGLWIEGVDFVSPVFEGDGPSVTLQLFLKPIDEPRESFDTEKLKEVVRGLHRHVYRQEADSPLMRETLPSSCQPQLRSAKSALHHAAAMQTK